MKKPFVDSKIDGTYQKMAPPVQGRKAREKRRNEAWLEAQALAKERTQKRKKKPR